MRATTFAALSLLLSAGAIAVPLHHARAQGATPPTPPETAPPPAAEGATPVPAPAAASGPAVPPPAVTHRNVNLRGGPGTSYALLRLIPAGTPVEVKECKSGWCQAVYQGTDGYIIESSIAPTASGPVARRRFAPMPGYRGPPPAYVMRLPGYYLRPPYRYYYNGPYYAPYWAWRRAYWRWW
jgi:Bacterial SH3 domain